MILLSAIAVFDARTYRIPDELNLALAVFGLVFSYTQGITFFEEALLGALLGFMLTMSIRILYKYWRSYHGIGLGDVKMIAAGGCWVGIDGIATVLFIASITGIVADLVARKFSFSSGGKKQKIPFGPYLAAGIIFSWSLKFLTFTSW